MYGPGQKPTRGLGGRIYVYNRNHKAIKVDGELVVYAYRDREDGTDENVKPDRKYTFSQEELEQFYSPSEFGPSYSVWLPWDEVGGDTQSISVVPIIKTEEGQALVGDHSRNLLPGRDSSGLAEGGTSDGVRRVSYENRQIPTYPVEATRSELNRANAAMLGGGVSETESESTSETLRSHTIELPATMQQRLRQMQDDGFGESSQSAARRRALKAEVARLRNEAREQTVAQDSSRSATVPANEGWAYRSRSSVRREPFRPRVPIASTVQADRGQLHSPLDHEASPSDLPSQLEDARTQDSNLGDSGVPRVWIEP